MQLLPDVCLLFHFHSYIHKPRWKALAKADKFKKIPLKEDDTQLVEDLQTRLAKATEKKQTAKSDEDRLSASALFEDAKANIKLVSGSALIYIIKSHCICLQ